MLSHENPLASPPSSAKRAGFNSPKTHQQYASSGSHNTSPPRTPPSQGSRNARVRQLPLQQRALTVRPSLRETFLDDVTPTDNVRGIPDYGERSSSGERDMHDLAFSPRHVTRASVFDNMLLSLDQFDGNSPERIDESRNYSAPYETDSYASNSRYGSIRTNRGRGHTFSSSLSSHNTGTFDEPISRRSNQSVRGNWGGQGIKLQSGQGNPHTLNPEEFISTRGKVYEAQRALPPSERNRTRGGRKSSKSSGSSSVDFTSMMAASRVGAAQDRRSESFDYPRTHRKAQSLESSNGLSGILSPSHSHHSRIDSIDVAPTPTVPAGPRPTHTFPPQPTHAPPLTPNLIRKNSAKSSKSRKSRPETLGTASIKGRSNDFATIRDVAELPIMPVFIQRGPAPSPTVSLHKPSLPSSVSTESTPQNKDPRPGFFRRVFGSRNVTPSQENFNAHISHTDTSLSRESERVLTLEEFHAASSHSKLQKSAPKEPSAPTPQSQGRDSTPTLNKKPSSFFRRRKKSISESTPPPVVIPAQHTLRLVVDRTKEMEPSPVTSLRTAMDPYLHGSPQPSPLHSPRYFDSKEVFESDHTSDGDEEYVERHFSNLRQQSSTNIPEPKSRKPKQSSAARLRGQTSPTAEARDPRSASNNNLSVPSHRPHTSRDADDSFLADSSGNEGPSSTSSQENLGQKPQSSTKRPKTSPTKSIYDQSLSLQDRNISLPSQNFAAFDDRPRMSGEVTRRAKPTHDDRKDSGRASNSSLPLRTNSRDQHLENIKPASLSREQLSPSNSPGGQGWLEPASSEEHLNESLKLSLPLDGAKESPNLSPSDLSSYKSANSTPVLTTPIITSDEALRPTVSAPVINVEQDEPTELDREQARMLFEGQEDHISQANAASWLGEHEPERERVRRAYMELFSWSGMSILTALRNLCARITLKGETQQLDRILDSFSTRWCECNPNHGFKATDVVHTICYSVILLNTDLHLADIDQKMTRAQFVRNTAPTIRRVVSEAAPDAFVPLRIGINTAKAVTVNDEPPSPMLKSPTFPSEGFDSRPSLDTERSSKPLPRPSDRLVRENSGGNPESEVNSNDSGPLVNTAFTGPKKAWENQIEIVLKNFYNSIHRDRLPLFGVTAEPVDPSTSSTNFLNLTGNVLRRSPSTLSKAASETLNVRGRVLENRIGTGRWTSKTRSRPRFQGASTIGSSRTSFDDGSSIWSPAGSSTWSKNSLGKTLTSMSVDSFGSAYRGDYQQSIGFANALSQAIIREETSGVISHDEPMRQVPLLEDESLELAGAPWAKEGMLKHKHHLDGVDKKSKDRNWNECFAVIEKGWMRLFSFNMSAKSLRLKNKNKNIAGGVVGGGNWTENAEEVWKFLLRQTIASALPPPGYSKARPHVWALSLPTGAVHLFQVGTPEIIKEFVASANYWSARLSKEPLFGSISNVEYGWSEAVINRALLHSDSAPPGGMTSMDRSRPSIQSSIRSSIEQQSTRARLPGDRANINEWTIPQQSMNASALLEVDQLKGLQTYVKNVEEELQRHNELRGAMNLAFSPRHVNYQKAMANWERKSSYLLREIVKFTTYIDCLQQAQAQKEKIYTERAAEKADNASMLQNDEAVEA